MKPICGGCPSEDEGCQVKFIEALRQTCVCKNCLIKSMCKVLCETRENMFLDLPHWIRNHLEEIHHYYHYEGEVEYNRLMKDLEYLVEEANNVVKDELGIDYEQL